MLSRIAGSESAKPTAWAGFGLFSGLGVIVAKSCCVLPLVLATTGMNSAWLSDFLPVLQPLQPYLLGVALFALSLGWFTVFRRRATDCRTDATCSPGNRWFGITALGISTVFVLIAAVTDWIEPIVVRYLAGVAA